MTKIIKQEIKNSNKTIDHSLVKGVLDVTRSGLGYVLMLKGEGDIIVKPGDFGNALNGDTVRVSIIKKNIRTGRKEGKIVEVITRRQTEFIGKIEISNSFAFFIADSKKPIPDFYIPQDKINGAVNHQKVIAKLTKWDKSDKKPIGEIIEILNEKDINNMAMKEIIAEGGFGLSFSSEVLAEANAIAETIDDTEIAKRIDFRNTLTFTIDPVDAKDFDDAISIKKIKGNLYQIGVHIADVSHFVTPNTLLDAEAYKRATSVYLPDRVNPMLPEKISNELCSLRPNEDKLTFSAIFDITLAGDIKKVTIGKTIIHSNHRFTYEEAQDIIEGKSQQPYKDEVLLLNSLSQNLRKQRFENGAINFSSTEVRFKLDDTGKPIGIVVKESKEAHQLIEELMLLANKAVAKHVADFKFKNEPVPFAYRIHDEPDEAKLKPFISFAKKFGFTFDVSTPQKIAESFNFLLQSVKGKPEQQILETLGIRTMAKAVYTSHNIGHYGLGFKYYCHFTSPIRRYPDVLVHRVLQSILQNNVVIDEKMEEKCVHSSKMERSAMDCERAGNKYKQVEFMKDKLGQQFEAVISGVAAFGFWAETVEHKCEGLISFASLSEIDDFRLVESDYCLVGKRTNKKYAMGDKVTIFLVAANQEKRQLDYELVVEKPAEKVKKVKSKK
jgi:ribonuclease R